MYIIYPTFSPSFQNVVSSGGNENDPGNKVAGKSLVLKCFCNFWVGRGG